MVIDYDELVLRRHEILPLIYDFVKLPYSEKFADMIHAKSLSKGKALSPRKARFIEKVCYPIYEEARAQISAGS